MNFSAQEISDILKGEVDGDKDISIFSLSKIEDGFKGSLSFLANLKYESFLYETKASLVVVDKDFIPTQKNHPTLIRVENAYQGFSTLLDLYNDVKLEKVGIENNCNIDSSARYGEGIYIGSNTYISENTTIGKNVKIYPNCFIGKNVNIGDNCIIEPGVNLLSNTIIGDDCIIHSGTIIGSDGFGFAPNNENDYKKVAQIGNVVIGNKVEIGANTTIDRATLGSTKINDGVKLDNLIQIAHNVEIGEHTVIAAQTGIAGSTKIGKNCMIGGQVGIVGHLTIADGVKIAAQSGIGSSIKVEGSIVQGSPAYNIGDYKRSYVYFRKLPNLYASINEIQKKLDKLLNSK
jgi:UDP-3-O-[3-hydroxymyristoyl] glucosamine N-acyltransferase